MQFDFSHRITDCDLLQLMLWILFSQFGQAFKKDVCECRVFIWKISWGPLKDHIYLDESAGLPK